ncbi:MULTISPECIES: hypothetical protein [unclassified Ectothiorhodospira]|uniref:hypothetical protein n=1 Tax=unclassified Ectothiorhodospira TaxID=2684909 RepID=UPI001EE7C32A|nr:MULTISPECIES: hypothetical protein [unclassified Ectothiorhodospira]MCG5517201.1 hypothetical protein [Ectothiorhodospira sp. 9100]MCG5519764.1 hypothetical protein [Ectothiorhodospira sp. 9905]
MQSGFFDLEDPHALLEKLGEQLPKFNRVVDWEAFRPTLQKVYQRPHQGLDDATPDEFYFVHQPLTQAA